MSDPVLLAEAYRRGILPPAQKAAYEEAVSRGLLPADKGVALNKRAASAMDTPAFMEPVRQGLRQFTGGLSEAFPAAVFGAGEAIKGGDFGKAYGAARDAETAMTTSRPSLLNTAAGVVGGLAMPIPAAKLLKGGSLLAKVGRGAAVGAGAGVLAGAGNAQSLQDIPRNAFASGVAGAALGGTVPVAFAAAQPIARAANAVTGGKLLDGTQGAVQRLRTALVKDRVDPAKIQQAVAAAQAAGGPTQALLDVAGENTRALLRTAASKPGGGRNMAVQYANRTRENMQGSALDRARKLTPDSRSAEKLGTDLQAERSTSAATGYAPAYAAEVPVTEATEMALKDGPGQAAIRQARADAVERMEPTGEYDRLLSGDFSQPVSGASMDRIRIAMGERAGKMARAGNNSRAAGAMTRKDLIDNSLDEVPEFAPARAAYKDTTGAIDAIDHGASVLHASPSDFAAKTAALTPKQIAAAQVGARQALTDAIGQPANAGGTLRKIAYADTTKQNLASLFGPQEAADYSRAAELELSKRDNANFISPNTGSQTQLRGEDGLDVNKVQNFFQKPFSNTAGYIASRLTTMTPQERAALISMGTTDASGAASNVFALPSDEAIASLIARSRLTAGGANLFANNFSGAR